MDIQKPYLLFLGDVPDMLAAKTAIGVVDWRPDWCVGQMRLEGCKADTKLPDMTIAEGIAKGAKTMVIGAVNAGGVLPAHWIATMVEALEAGMDLACGLHIKLSDIPEVAAAAQKHGCQLWDLREPPQSFPTGKGHKRTGKRILTVGTDCSVGKKYTALAMEKALNERGVSCDYRATGQTGVLISGRGVALDSVIADFISGAAEWLSPDADEKHWDSVEGQGSLLHPSYAGVTLGLLHGTQPDAFIVCHEPTRTTMRGVKTPMPTIRQVIDLTVLCGSRTNPDIRCVGISVNTSALGEEEAKSYLADLSKEYGVPATDPIRFGIGNIADHLISEFGA